MNNVVFPLRLLPNKVQRQVIKNLDIFHLISFSLISKKSKALVQSFKTKVEKFLVEISEEDSLSFTTFFGQNRGYSTFTIHSNPDRDPDEQLCSLDQVTDEIEISTSTGNWYNTPVIWKNLEFLFLEWVQHFCSLFIFSESSLEIETGNEIFDSLAIRNLLPEWTDVDVFEASIEYSDKIFELFAPFTKNFITVNWRDGFPTSQKFVIQNYDSLYTDNPFTLDDAIISNASKIVTSRFTIPDFNRFIKHWMKMSNPRLKKFKAYDIEELNDGKLLKGIQHQVMPDDLVREWYEKNTIRGGIDIRNKKGILATLVVEKGIRFMEINMFVWN